MPYVATFSADFTKWDKALADAQKGLKTFEVTGKGVQRQLERMSNSFVGVNIKKEADLAAAAVKAIGGASKLTEAEQRKVNATVTEAIAKYKALGQQAPAELRKLQKETQQVEKSTGLLGGAITKVGALMAGAFTVGAITNLARKTLEFAGNMADLSAQTGIGVEALQEFKFAGGQVGVSIDAVTSAVGRLQNNIGEGNKSAAAGLKSLGLSIAQVKALRPEDQFRVVAERLKDVKDQTEFVKIGMDLMGKGFMEVAPLIRGDLQKLTEDARKLGVVLDRETIEALDSMGDRLDALSAVGMAGFAKALVHLEQPLTVLLQGVGLVGDALKVLQDGFTHVVGGAILFQAHLYDLHAALRTYERAINPIIRLTGQLDDEIASASQSAKDARLQYRLMFDEIARQEKLRIIRLASGQEIRVAPIVLGDSGGGLGEIDKELEKLKATLSGANIQKDLRDLERAWSALTPTQRANEDVIKRTLSAYEKLRTELPRVGGALENLRSSHLTLLEVSERTDVIMRRLSATTMPNAEVMFRSGQAALDGLARSGALMSSRVASMEALMRTLPPVIKGTAVAAQDYERRVQEAAEASAAWRKNLEDVATAFATLSQIAPGAIGRIAELLGRVVGSVNLAVKGFDAIKEGLKVGAGTLQGLSSITAGVLGLASAVLSLGSAIADALFKSRAEKTMERVAYEFGVSISDGLAQGIEDAAERQFGGNRQASKIFHLDRIISEGGGLSSQNFQQLFARFRDLFSMVETGAFTAAEGIDVLDKNFKTFADFVTKGGSLASRELLDIINLTERFGMKSAEVSSFVVQETSKALGGLSTFLSNVSVQTQAAADGIGAALFGIFEAQTRNGIPAAEIIKQLDPLIQKLDEQLKKAGLSGGAAFDEIRALAAVASHEIAGPLISGVLGLEQALAGLHNSGVLTEEMFDGLTASVADTYKQIQATGVDGAKALQLIAPSLQTIWELQQDFNYTVDEATQALLDEAKAAGIVGDAHRTAQEQMLRLMERQTEALEGIARLFGVDLPNAVGDFKDALDDLPTDISIDANVDWNIPEMPPHTLPYAGSGTYEDQIPGFATGTPGLGFMNFGSGKRVDLHGTEAVVPEHRKEEAAARWGGGDTTIAVVVVGQGATFHDVLMALPRKARQNENQWAAKLAGELAKFGVH